MTRKRNSNAQYVIGRVETKKPGRPLFKVAKFAGGDQPSDVYNVTYVPPQTEHGTAFYMCNCPNSRSGNHIDDKHGRMVADWIKRGEPKTGYYDGEGRYHAT